MILSFFSVRGCIKSEHSAGFENRLCELVRGFVGSYDWPATNPAYPPTYVTFLKKNFERILRC